MFIQVIASIKNAADSIHSVHLIPRLLNSARSRNKKRRRKVMLELLLFYSILCILLSSICLHVWNFPGSHYYVTMNIGDPAKPYFLDVDTGSDLTWLQCNAPCQSCNKVHSARCYALVVQSFIITPFLVTSRNPMVMVFMS
jgi:hypothetical protein